MLTSETSGRFFLPGVTRDLLYISNGDYFSKECCVCILREMFKLYNLINIPILTSCKYSNTYQIDIMTMTL